MASSQPKKTSRTSPRRCSATPATKSAPASRASFDDRLDLLGRVVDARHQRRDQDAGADPALLELRHRLEPRPRARRVRLGLAPDLLVESRHREVDGDIDLLRHPLVEVDVAQRKRRLGQHRDRRPRLLQRLDDLRHEPVAPLDPLVRIGVGPDRHQLPLPARPRQLPPQHLRRVDLDDDLALEVAAGVEAEVGVGATGEAVVADDAVGDEVTGAGGDVEELEVVAEPRPRPPAVRRPGPGRGRRFVPAAGSRRPAAAAAGPPTRATWSQPRSLRKRWSPLVTSSAALE